MSVSIKSRDGKTKYEVDLSMDDRAAAIFDAGQLSQAHEERRKSLERRSDVLAVMQAAAILMALSKKAMPPEHAVDLAWTIHTLTVSYIANEG